MFAKVCKSVVGDVEQKQRDGMKREIFRETRMCTCFQAQYWKLQEELTTETEDELKFTFKDDFYRQLS